MFDRYTQRARRVIFFARYEASEFGSLTIESEHLLLGLLREDQNLLNRFLQTPSSIESIRKGIEARTTIREKISPAIDLPLTTECKRILAYANEEAERLNHRHIGTEHLFLGILREQKCLAAVILHEMGLRVEAIRNELARSVAKPGYRAPSFLSQRLIAALETHKFLHPRDHLEKALNAERAEDWATSKNELALFFESLVKEIEGRKPNALAPVFAGFDWQLSLRQLKSLQLNSLLPDQEDYHFKARFILSAAEQLLTDAGFM